MKTRLLLLVLAGNPRLRGENADVVDLGCYELFNPRRGLTILAF